MDVSAEPIYAQMRVMNGRITEQKEVRARLEASLKQSGHEVPDAEGLKARLKRAVMLLEQATPDLLKEVFAATIKYVEIHPTSIKLGLFAPKKTTTPKEGGGAAQRRA